MRLSPQSEMESKVYSAEHRLWQGRKLASTLEFVVNFKVGGPAIQILRIQRIPLFFQYIGSVFKLAAGLTHFRPLQLREDNVFRSSNKKWHALEGDFLPATKGLLAVGPGFAENEIDFPSCLVINRVEHRLFTIGR